MGNINYDLTSDKHSQTLCKIFVRSYLEYLLNPGVCSRDTRVEFRRCRRTLHTLDTSILLYEALCLLIIIVGAFVSNINEI